MSGSANIQGHAIEVGMDKRAAVILATHVARAHNAVVDAIKILESLQDVLKGDDPNEQLWQLRSLAGHAGYSNTAATAVSELFTAAGAVAALLEATA